MGCVLIPSALWQWRHPKFWASLELISSHSSKQCACHWWLLGIPAGHASHPSPGSGLSPEVQFHFIFFFRQNTSTASINPSVCEVQRSSLQILTNIPCLTVLNQQHCSQEINSPCLGWDTCTAAVLKFVPLRSCWKTQFSIFCAPWGLQVTSANTLYLCLVLQRDQDFFPEDWLTSHYNRNTKS